MSPVYKLSNAGGFTSKQEYVSMLAGNATFIPSSYESIATATVSGSASGTISFTNIPQIYTHLQIRGVLRGTDAKNSGYGYFTLTNSTNTNSTAHFIIGDGTSASAASYVTRQDALSYIMPCNSATSGVFGGIIVDIADYRNTNKNKTSKILFGFDRNTPGIVGLSSALHYVNTNAITDITFVAWDLGTFAVGSTLALYGLRSA
jgi:hypothetical protein